jgi:hypothetical protein
MRRFSFGVALAALPAFALSLMLSGCGGSKDTGPVAGGGGGGEATKEAPSGPAKVLEAKGGVLKGSITLVNRPDIKKMTEDFQNRIAKEKPDQKDNCMKGDAGETGEQTYRLGANGKLGNVFVWIQPVDGTFFKVDEKAIQDAKAHPVKIRQPHCAFIPHVAVVWAEYHPDPNKPKSKKPTGQFIEVHNDSTFTSHNTKYEAGVSNPGGNETIPTGGKMEIKNLKADSKEMKLNCNIHTWMDGYIRLVDTPYYTISYSDTLDGADKVKEDDPKFGTYEIKNLPVGKVKVIAWHERCGYLNKNGGRGEEIEIAEGKPTEKNFEAKPQ